ncbi:hypothetical protein [Isoptericola dokdonensis]|uniref:Uncharacterized protein n=1 Tax=Isoptericola dokdonensis DS-3 TaxID=1300344 RepID=A0A168EC27_9MICO|nr:hypothetical protein [Isoptericola dokdonensis]ANC29858.1 hypothetical protein I598_0267 [Isoptericola dokdonensis DS-3]
MSSPTGRPRSARVLRGGVAATVATGVALASHVAGGGAVPGLLGVLAPWVVSLWVGTLVGGRPARWRAVVSVAAGQVAFHTLFVLGTPTGAVRTGGAHAHHAQLPPVPASTDANVAALQGDTTMWVWHAAAAAATAALLFHGEALLHHLRHLAGLVVSWLLPRRDLVPVGAPRPVRPAVVAAGHRPARHGPELSLLRRRGPPVLTV